MRNYLRVKQKNEEPGKLLKDHGKKRNPKGFEYFGMKKLPEAEFLLLFRHFFVELPDDHLRSFYVASSQPPEVDNSLGNATLRHQPP